MTVLITGGAGFIGSNLIHHLLDPTTKLQGKSATKIVNLDLLTYAGRPENLTEATTDPRYHFQQGDIQDAALLAHLFTAHRPDAVFHLAAESHVDRSIDTPSQFLETNVLGTFHLLEATRHYLSQHPEKADVFRFLHVSTDEVFGSLSPTDPAFTEASPYQPNSPYSASKAASDHFVRAYHHTYQLPVITTNCSNNYGPRQYPEKLIPLVIKKALNGENIPIYGSGTQVRDWLYVTDHCRGLVAAFNHGHPGETYNFGGETELTNLVLVQHLLQEIRHQGHPQATPDLITHVRDRPGHDQRYAIDITKARHHLHWHPHTPFPNALQRTVAWYLDQ